MIRHLLLDADGVLQRSAPDPIGLLRQWAGDRAEELGRALWTAERGPLRGEGDFLHVVDAVVPALRLDITTQIIFIRYRGVSWSYPLWAGVSVPF